MKLFLTVQMRPRSAAGAITVTNFIVSDRDRAQHGGDVRDVGVCVAEPGRRKALHITGGNYDRGTIPARRFSDGGFSGFLPSYLKMLLGPCR
jgi:hypothetical protein